MISDFQGATSLSQCARDLLAVLKNTGCLLELLDLPLSPDRIPPGHRLSMDAIDYATPQSELSIIHWNGDAYPILARDLPSELFENRRIIGVWYWETNEGLPEGHRRGFDLVDEVWVTTQFIADGLSKISPVPVRKFPQLITPPEIPARLSLPPELDNERFVYFFSFDFRSVGKRKNPECVCEAFVRAFPAPTANGPICVIKSAAGLDKHPLQYLALKQRYQYRPDILFIDGWMTVEQHDSLIARANCCVSLHRSEGLGLLMMKAMSLGKPCIATNYSGNLEFMTDANSWLVPCEQVEIGTGCWPYPPHHTWAEPDLNAAAAAMREVYNHPQLASEKGRKARQTILEQHGLAAVSRKVADLLVQAAQISPRTKPALGSKNVDPVSNARARAYQLIKQSKELEKHARSQRHAISKRKLPPELESYLAALQQIIKLQHEIHSETLRDLGELKQQLHNYHPALLDSLLRDRDLMTDLLKRLVDTQPPQA